MQLIEGAHVYTAAGDRIGTVSRVVVAPETKQATHLVVMEECLSSEERVIPARLVESATTERIILYSNAETLIELPGSLQAHALTGVRMAFSNQEMFGSMLTLFQYPPVGQWWVAGSHTDAPSIHLSATHDALTHGVQDLVCGTGVYGCDGVYVGGVERVFTTPDSDKVTHVVLQGGELFGWRKLIHAEWLAGMADGEIHLSVDARFIDNLPDYTIYD